MGDLLKSLPLGLFFRGLAPGGFFVLAYAASTNEWFKIADALSNNFLNKWLPLAAFSGVVVYTIHRSVIYPGLFEWWIDWITPWRNDGRAWRRLIRDDTVENLLTLWQFGDDQTHAKLVGHLTGWADYAHLQYSSAWCIGIGAWLGSQFDNSPHQFSLLIFLLALALCLCGLISDLRLRIVRSRVIRIATRVSPIP
jgi:hypothetical protein